MQGKNVLAGPSSRAVRPVPGEEETLRLGRQAGTAGGES